jgi:osmotically inducible protein OsmC
VGLDKGVIGEIQLFTRVKADGLDQASFEKFAQDAKDNCPVSKLLNATITLDAELV